jgi:16S rRNA (cytosine967-C5)-methyltransferase
MLKLQGGNKPVTQTDLYLQHAIYLQSLSSGLVSHVLNPQPSAIVVDLCAAPGSKTAHLAQLMKNHGNIIAFDNILFRVQELRRNITRLGVRNTHILLANSFDPPLRKEFHADYVLIDPPCSNTGVIQTRPEVKWHITPDLIRRIRRVQLTLLKQGTQLVAPDGYAVYSTCSITLEENEKLIRKFLASNPDFELVVAEPQMGTEALEGLVECQRLYPHKNDTEGFFIAKLHRKLNLDSSPN